MKRRACLFGLPVLLGACRRAASPPVPASWRLLDAPWAASWQAAGIPDQGGMMLRDGVLTLAAGQPMTGTRFTAWSAPAFPETDYAVSYEARRTEGEDIFAMLTFPVGSHQAHATFVLGGWGGTVTGISSIDFKDANENATRAEQRFDNGRWYRVRLEVRPAELRAWLDDRLIVNVHIGGRRISLRPGFIDHCLPFGFASYGSAGEVRAVVVERL